MHNAHQITTRTLAENILAEIRRIRGMQGYTEDDGSLWLGAPLHNIEDNARAIILTAWQGADV